MKKLYVFSHNFYHAVQVSVKDTTGEEIAYDLTAPYYEAEGYASMAAITDGGERLDGWHCPAGEEERALELLETALDDACLTCQKRLLTTGFDYSVATITEDGTQTKRAGMLDDEEIALAIALSEDFSPKSAKNADLIGHLKKRGVRLDTARDVWRWVKQFLTFETD